MHITPLFETAFQGKIRKTPEDFQVDEIMNIPMDGEGEHQWLKIQKREANTDWVAGQLARIAGIQKRDVGYAGLKDRNAVTTQWFSLHVPGRTVEDIAVQLPEGVVLLEEHRHSKKLRRGALEGNQFTLVLRECAGDAEAFQQAVNKMAEQGMPNYFGSQRFGHGGNNIENAKKWFAGEFKPKKRPQKSMYLSAARSYLFNEILNARVQAANWNQAVSGDVLQFEGSHSWFVDEGEADIPTRVDSLDIHPTAALWGRGALPTKNEALALETRIAEQHEALCDGLERNGLQQDRRAMRVLPKNVVLQRQSDQEYALKFILPAGSYATVFLANCGEFVA
ncbi:MAG: tRNA pseudouridine 13 synthase (EC [uncultured Thiotrichaceae bacterium]|uniref:tRNA pseudouridine synthase D n=1 Tax=uncultured Thiotrichaceae bacterium TaxID=298394 RepID=A0A6S6TFL4_9GAMM|nr:MAG: tRNA pseudouridine 13 synthase (EC [uncultured Thiotrichaceae bacterium]